MDCIMFDILPFKSFIDLVMDSTKTIELIFNQDELKISLLNNAHVCFYDAVFKKDFFDYYQVNDVESVVLDTNDLFKILKSSKGGDELHIESNEGYVIFKLESRNGNRRIFELPLIDEEYNSPAPPEIEYDLDFLVDIDLVNQSVSDLDNIVNTDRIKFVVSDDGVSVISPADSMTNYWNELNDSVTGNAVVTVNTAYVGGLSKLKKINEVVELRIGNDIPLTWNVTSATDDVSITGLIAPIIENED